MSKKSIIKRIDRLLGPLGFVRRSATWNRKYDSLVHAIDVQTSKVGDSVTVNTGVFDPEVYVRCWGKDPPLFIDEPSCIVRARLGTLIGDKKDLWWQTGDENAEDDIAFRMNSVVLPFLERMDSPEKMMQFLTDERVTEDRYPLPIIYLAILKDKLGDRAGAHTLLVDLRKKISGSSQGRVDEAMTRLGFL